MKRIILLALLALGMVAANAQSSLKFGIGKGKSLTLFTADGSVDIEGYNGDTLLIEAVKVKKTPPAAAEGLFYVPFGKQVPADSIGYKIVKDTVNFFELEVTGSYRHLHILIPNNLPHTELEISSPMPGAELSVKNYEGDLEIIANIQRLG